MATWMKACRSTSLLSKLLGVSAATALSLRLLSSESLARASNVETGNDEKKLVSVVMFTRHGARTPLFLISGIEQAEYKPEWLDPYVKASFKLRSLENDQDFDDDMSVYDKKNTREKLKGNVGRGQLTSVGEQQMFELGRVVRKKYLEELKFLSPEYNPKEIYTRSTHFKRTIHSAKSVLAGIYSKSDDVAKMKNDSKQNPFVIHVERLNQDYLFPNVIMCPYFGEAREFYEKLKLFKNSEYIENLKALNMALPLDKNEPRTPTSFTAFRDDLLARKVHGLEVPKNLESFLEISHRYGNMEITAQNDFNLKLSCGLLLGLLKQNLLNSAHNDSKQINQNDHKFRYYSAHDTTINALMIAFDQINDENHEWPPFAANIIIELWRNSNNSLDPKYSVKVFYCGKPIDMAKGSNECQLDNFIKLIERNTIERHEFNTICNQKFTK